MKIIVGMSGGVDSSVTAALLVQQGHEVIGAFMKNWTDTKDVSGVCDWKNDKRDAQRVAAKLGIPLMVLDFQKEYKEAVVDYMFKEYSAGRTPNPDVMCNNMVKFGPFLKAAEELGADKIATGHYARLQEKDDMYQLMQAVDNDKDQTYFLHRLNQDQLSKTLFPIGEYSKEKVRDLACEFDLPTAERKESMGVCFIGDINVKEFLKQKIKPQPGSIVTTSGQKVGEHDGLPYYTIGQRHGFGSNGGTEPLYVVDKDFKNNSLIVGSENDPALFKTEIQIDNMHWTNQVYIKKLVPELVEGRESQELRCQVRFRHRQPLQDCVLVSKGDQYAINCLVPQRAITPGQFAVIYKDAQCLGGGEIN